MDQTLLEKWKMYFSAMEQPTGQLQQKSFQNWTHPHNFPHTGAPHWKQIILQILLSQKPASELAGQFYLYVQARKRHQQLWLPHFITLSRPHGPIIPEDDHITPHKTDQLSGFLSQEHKYEINNLIPSFFWLTSGLLWIFLCPHSSVVLVPLWQKVQSCQ